jgi:hypothetical protein
VHDSGSVHCELSAIRVRAETVVSLIVFGLALLETGGLSSR